MALAIEMLAEPSATGTRLSAPGVGTFSGALPRGSVLVPGQIAGALTTLGRSANLVVPGDVRGVVRSEPPALAHAPVGWGTLLYELEPLEAHAASHAAIGTPSGGPASGALVLRAPQTGRFYHRPAPAQPPLIEPGQILGPSTPVGLIEVMKTFTHVLYRTDGGLPPSARAVRWLAADGSDVSEGDPLLEVAPV